MRLVTWAIRLLLFLLLVAFAAKNVQPVTLRFYFDVAVETPLVVALFGFFAAGALFGILALLGAVVRQRRQIAALRKKVPAEGSGPPTVPEL